MTSDEVIKILKDKFGKVQRTSGGWVRITCPTCTPNDAKHMKRYVHPVSLYSGCFICGVKLSFQELTGLTVFERVTPSDDMPDEPEEHPLARVMPCTKYLRLTELEKDHPAIQFLNKDYLFDIERYSREHHMAFIPGEGGLPLFPGIFSYDSLIFPVYYRNEMVGWQLRFIPGTWNGDKMQKIRYMHLFKKGQYLYNYDNAKQFEMVIVTEGVKKALKFPNGVATFGKSITDTQLQLIGSWKEIVLMLDGEDETQELAERLARQLAFKKVVNIDLRNHGAISPDDLPAEQLEEIVYKEWSRKYVS